MVLVIRSIYSGPAANGGGVSTLCFANPQSESAAQGYADQLDEFWTQMCATYLSPDVTVQIDSVGTIYAAGDGSLQEVYNLGSYDQHTGAISTISVPRSSQALIQLKTSGIVNNRLVKGRMFVPGLPAGSANGGGGLLALYRTGIAGLFSDFLDNTAGTVEVWSRPKTTSPARAGSEHLVTSSDVWGEFAVLRSRRD